jgi:hypothetical protein
LRADKKRVSKVASAPILSLIRPEVRLASAVPKTKLTWGISALEVDKLWAQGITGKGVKVGHLDTGADGTHPALASAIDQFAEVDLMGSLVSPTPKPHDSAEHGTHTAATIAGRPVKIGSTQSNVGVAPEAKLISAMVIEGGDVVARVLGGMNWAVGQGIRVLSMSLGIRGYHEDFEPVTQALRAHGVLPVFAAGNEGPGTSRSPGNYPEVLSVGAMDKNNRVADFSSSQRFVRVDDPLVPDLVGPGVDIISAKPGGGFQSMDGTSMATPHLAGLAALLFQAKPSATPDEVEQAIYDSCHGGPGLPKERANRGFPNAPRALASLLKGIKITSNDKGKSRKGTETHGKALTGPLKAKFVKVEDKYKTHHNVHLKVVLTNTSKKDLSVLKWNTPLDIVLTDCLQVTVNGKAIEYDGPLVKRSAPGPEDYIVIKAGQSVQAEFPVSDAYDTSKPGNYHVELKTQIPDVAPKELGLAAELKADKRTPVQQPISAQTSFKVTKGAGAHDTLGAAARRQEKVETAALAKTGVAAGAKKKSAKAGPLAALTAGGTAAQKTAALRAHSDGYGLCTAALKGMANDPKYKEWFGAFDAARFNKVKGDYTAVKTRLETVQFTYNLTGSGCKPGVFAYTYKGTSTVWFCDAFWDAPTKGTDSKAGTVVHEHTHSDANTDDIAYGQPACRNLALTNPDKAINNADSHEYYAGG